MSSQQTQLIYAEHDKIQNPRNALIDQLVGQRIENPDVGGSNPAPGHHFPV